MGIGIGGVGIPGVIGAALREYTRRRRDLELVGMSRDEADARILSEARASAGVLAVGERIDLSAWSERLGVPQAVLEALVLSIQHAEPRPPASVPPVPSAPPAPEIAYVEDPSLTEPMTPAPMAMRWPRFEVPDLLELVAPSDAARADLPHFRADFRFPDRATMERCLAPLGVVAMPGLQSVVLEGVTVRARIAQLDLELRLDPEAAGAVTFSDSARARGANRALALLELRAFKRP